MIDEEQTYLVMDDTTNIYDFDDLAAFESTLDPFAVSEAKRQAESVLGAVRSVAA